MQQQPVVAGLHSLSDRPRSNHLEQAIGTDLPDWRQPATLSATDVHGSHVRLEPLTPEHTPDLFEAFSEDREGYGWTYLPYGPFASEAEFRLWTTQLSKSSDPLMYALVDTATSKALGVASYLRINPASGSAEVGHIHFSNSLKKTKAATEAMFLMAQHVFDLGYRRYEWKCDALNQNSRQAAARFGFTYEGIFRQATVYKGRNRDTAWYSIIDSEWPALRDAYETWLQNENFDEQGQQRQSLSSLLNLSQR